MRLTGKPRSRLTSAFFPNGAKQKAFSRLELLAVLVVVGLLVLIKAPALANDKNRSKSITCLSNLRELSVGWISYADDNDGNLMMNIMSGDTFPELGPNWVSGYMDWNTSSSATNILFLIDPKYALIASYVRTNASLFKCPEDTFVSASQLRVSTTRARSYSMNNSMGPGNFGKSAFLHTNALFLKYSDLTQLKPYEAIVFLDEHPDSINDPSFVFDFATVQWLDLPGSLHQGAGTLSFADGHVEMHSWIDPRTIRPVRYSYETHRMAQSKDWEWLKTHLSVGKFQQ